MVSQRRECPENLCDERVVLEVTDGAAAYATLSQVTVRCPEHGYRMERSERP